ncbi:unnamed protein product [Fusarium fujikuroi]|nr:unnamed protein product [Fusarium fujikuroi]
MPGVLAGTGFELFYQIISIETHRDDLALTGMLTLQEEPGMRRRQASSSHERRGVDHQPTAIPEHELRIGTSTQPTMELMSGVLLGRWAREIRGRKHT